MKKYIRSQSGAALILVLFAVLFLTIAGAVLLNTTTYSLQSNEKNEKNQNEFYLLEGAIDLMIYTMDDYEFDTGRFLEYDNGKLVLDENNKQIEIIVSGPFYYLDNGEPTTQEFYIDGKEVVVSIEDKVLTDPYNVNQKKYEYKLVSKMKENQNLKREIYLNTIVESKDGIIATSSDGGTNTPEFPGNSTDRIIYTGSAKFGNDFDNWKKISRKAEKRVDDEDTFQRFLDYYNLDSTLIRPNGIKEFGKVRYIDNIHESGSDTDFKVEEGYITYANKVKITGCGSTGIVTIDGVLIAKEIEITGNCPYTLNGGIITEKFSISGSKHKILTTGGNGFDEDGGAGGYVPNPPTYGTVTPSDRNWGSSITEITNTETKR